MLVLNKLKV